MLDIRSMPSVLLRSGPPRRAGSVASAIAVRDSHAPAFGQAAPLELVPRVGVDDDLVDRVDRIHREADVMRILHQVLPPGVVPQILFEDRDNYCFAMRAIAAEHTVWKQSLLEGKADPAIAARLGTYLGRIHCETAIHPHLTEPLIDRTVFVELRVDPFYRHLAEKFPEAAPALRQLIEDMRSHADCLVLGDFSPKNILITQDGEITLVDFETGHRGDPTFDLGFFLSHLLLKTIRFADRFDEYALLTTEFWKTYLEELAPLESPNVTPESLLRRTLPHLAACMWSRIDATSPIDYLTTEPQKNSVRQFAQHLLKTPPKTWPQTLSTLKQILPP